MESCGVGATLAVSDAVPAVLAEAMRGDGALTAADQIAVALAEWGSVPVDKASGDTLGLVISESGRAVAVTRLTPFKVGVLVVTWPTRQMVAQFPTHATASRFPAYASVSRFAAHSTATRITGWPYTLVQKAA